MKKSIFFIGLALAALASCTKVETPVEQTGGLTVLTATIEATKVDASSTYGLSWANGDEISVWTSKGRFVTFSNSGSGAVDKFVATLDAGETASDYAIYPASSSHAFDGTTLTLNLPDTYAWQDGHILMPMVASVSGSTLEFKHAGGLLAFEVSGVPASATAFKLVANNSLGITGDFTYSAGKIEAASGSTANTVTVNFPAGTASSMRFLVPVPTGTYDDFTISALAGTDEIAKTVKQVAAAANVVAARTALRFALTFPSTDIYVSPAGAGTKTGSDASNAATLDKALAMADDGDVLHLAAGTYKGAFTAAKNVTIQGAGKTATILDGESTNMPLHVTAAGDATNKVFIKDITIQNGSGGAGGGILIGTTSFAEISDCLITNNTASTGGGGLDNGGTTVVSNTTFSSNTCTHASNGGGAVWNMETTGNLTLNNCVFTNNNATYNGGAVYNKGVLTSNNCTYSENVAGNNAGAFYNSSKSQMFAKGDTYTGNSAKTSGVIYNDGNAQATFDEVSANDNSAVDYGAVFRHWSKADGGFIRVYNSHIYGNHITATASTRGGTAAEVSGAYGNILFVNCTIGGNDSNRHVGSIYVRENAATCKGIIVSCTITGNTHKNSSYSIHAGGSDSYIAVYNSIVAANTNTASGKENQEVSSTAVIKNSVTNNAQTSGLHLYLFDSTGAKGTDDYAPVANILCDLDTDVYPLAGGSNPAVTGGMTTTDLTTLAGTLGVDSAILLKDQKGNSRSGKQMMGAYIGD